MDEYREVGKPTTASANERQDVVLNGWQLCIANLDAELADGKDTFNRKPAQQSVQEEYTIYVSGALSAGSTFDPMGFWKVRRFYKIYHNIYSHKLLIDTRAYLSNDLSHCNGLSTHSSICRSLRKGLLIQCGDRHKEEEQNKAGVNGGASSPQIRY
jgi:hypothetical protein